MTWFPLQNQCGSSKLKIPAPVFNEVRVLNALFDDLPVGTVPGLVDTGADRSVVPLEVCDRLGYSFDEVLPAKGYDGKQTRCRVYTLHLDIPQIGKASLRVFAAERKTILIGRDFLMALKARLIVDYASAENCPFGRFRIDVPSQKAKTCRCRLSQLISRPFR